jgi:D-hydroxyproline dehydrogenase subunit beta
VRGADVVVVGGGVIGCACARELARRGLGVTLVERESLAAGASGRNHGLLLTPTDPELVPMTRHSFAVYREIAADPPLPLRLEREATGILIVAADEESREYAAAEADAARRCGIPVERLDTAALHTAEPELAGDLEEAWLLDDARIVAPRVDTRWLQGEPGSGDRAVNERGSPCQWIRRPHLPRKSRLGQLWGCGATR